VGAEVGFHFDDASDEPARERLACQEGAEKEWGYDFRGLLEELAARWSPVPG
jgi:hypothetical protein